MDDYRIDEIVLEVIMNKVEGRSPTPPLGYLLLCVASQVRDECEAERVVKRTILFGAEGGRVTHER